MAGKNDIRPSTEVVLTDGTKIQVRPVSLRKVRKLIKAIKGLDSESGELSDDSIDKMIEASAIVLNGLIDIPEGSNPEEYIEDLIDLKAFNTMLTAAMGADPNE